MSLDSLPDSDAFRRLRSDVAANVRRARSLHDTAVNQLQVSLKTELAIGMTHSRIALRCGNPKRRPDMRREDIRAGRSINLALANRGLAALARVGLEEAVRRLTIPMRGRMLHDERGALQLVPYGQQPHDHP